MLLISLLDHSIAIVSVVKPVVGAQKVHKTQVTIPVEHSGTFDVDIWAMYLKKALSDAELAQKKLKTVDIIVAQRFLLFTRVDIPADIIDSALDSYIQEMPPSMIPAMKSTDVCAYEIASNRGVRHANVYVLPLETYRQLVTLLSLFDGTIGRIFPESPLLFSSFSHTLNQSKPEPALFIEYDSSESVGLLYDADGLRNGEVLRFNSAQLTKELKQIAKKDEKPSRLIVGGSLSTDMRQDSFTKEVGIWTNPLHRIIGGTNLAETAQSLGMQDDLLEFLPSVALINMLRRETAALELKITPEKSHRQVMLPKVGMPSNSRPVIFKALIILLIVIFTATITYGIIWAGRNASLNSLTAYLPKKPVPTAVPSPIPTPTPVPFLREKFEIAIQNGEGTPGLAGKFKTRLEEAGYRVGKTGNADEYTVTVTIIKTGNTQLYENLSKDLKQYLKNTPKHEKNDATDSAELILGADSV